MLNETLGPFATVNAVTRLPSRLVFEFAPFTTWTRDPFIVNVTEMVRFRFIAATLAYPSPLLISESA